MKMKIDIDLADLNDLIEAPRACAGGVEQAAGRALARSGDMAVTAAKRQLAEETGAHVRDLDEFVRGHLTAGGRADILDRVQQLHNQPSSGRSRRRGCLLAVPPDTHNVQIILGNSAMMEIKKRNGKDSAMMEIKKRNGKAYRPGGACSSEISGCRRNKLLSLGTLHH
jgi:hypothetical protein